MLAIGKEAERRVVVKARVSGARQKYRGVNRWEHGESRTIVTFSEQLNELGDERTRGDDCRVDAFHRELRHS